MLKKSNQQRQDIERRLMEEVKEKTERINQLETSMDKSDEIAELQQKMDQKDQQYQELQDMLHEKED